MGPRWFWNVKGAGGSDAGLRPRHVHVGSPWTAAACYGNPVGSFNFSFVDISYRVTCHKLNFSKNGRYVFDNYLLAIMIDETINVAKVFNYLKKKTSTTWQRFIRLIKTFTILKLNHPSCSDILHISLTETKNNRIMYYN